ncbi:MAG: VOC family protein [Acidobacteria bacterium]|nr:VOC family protein [Acidobacteriota bacterium]
MKKAIFAQPASPELGILGSWKLKTQALQSIPHKVLSMKRFAILWAFFWLVQAGILTNQRNHETSGVSLATSQTPIIRTHAVKLNVTDMGKALAFYTTQLGFQVADRSGFPNSVLLETNERVKLVLNRVKKLRKTSPTDTDASFTLQVNDLDQAIARMKSLKVQFAEKHPRKEGVGNAISIVDPFGRSISLMHQTIVKVEPFQEPRLYNFGFTVPEMESARRFYTEVLGFQVRSEKYLPLDLPLGHSDKSFAFMLHYRAGIRPVEYKPKQGAAFNTVVFETDQFDLATQALQQAKGQILSNGVTSKGTNTKSGTGGSGRSLTFLDPFGNVSELIEVGKH